MSISDLYNFLKNRKSVVDSLPIARAYVFTYEAQQKQDFKNADVLISISRDLLASFPDELWPELEASGISRGEMVGGLGEDLVETGSLIKQFGYSVSEWIKSGFKVTPDRDLEVRLSICKVCPHWESDGFVNTGRCLKCGCSTQAKLRMATSKCPLGKWGEISSEPNQHSELHDPPVPHGCADHFFG